MSYRLIDANKLAIKYPEVNDMPCIYGDLPNGLDGKYHIIIPDGEHHIIIPDVEHEDNYYDTAKKLDEIEFQDFAMWYLSRAYITKLEDQLKVATNAYEIFAIKKQLDGLKLTVDVLAEEIF